MASRPPYYDASMNYHPITCDAEAEAAHAESQCHECAKVADHGGIMHCCECGYTWYVINDVIIPRYNM